jgi:hypothetical protein
LRRTWEVSWQTVKTFLGCSAPTLDFKQQGGGAARVAVIDTGREFGEVLPWSAGRDECLHDSVLFAPAVEECEELVKDAGEDP